MTATFRPVAFQASRFWDILCCTRRLYTPLVQGLPHSIFGQDHCVTCDPRQVGAHTQAFSLTRLLFPAEFIIVLLEKMQTQEILRMLRLAELGEVGQFFHSLSATTLMSMGALAAILAYWFTHRPKALQPPCNLLMQSEEVEVSRVPAVSCGK